MEEIITVDGRQFKLTVDRPLTAEQKAQTIAEIKKQTGCGSCGPRVAKMGNDWQYGGVKSLPAQTGNPPGCPGPLAPGGSPGTAKGEGDLVTMSVTPVQGVAPYSLVFRKSAAGNYDKTYPGTTEIISRAFLVAPGAPYGDPAGMTMPGADVTGVYGNIVEGGNLKRVYTLTLLDIQGATSVGAGATMIFGSTLTDSCSPASTCTNFCEIFVSCPAPVCDFTVT